MIYDHPPRCPFVASSGLWRCGYNAPHEPARLLGPGECMSDRYPGYPEVFREHVERGAVLFEAGHCVTRTQAAGELWAAELARAVAALAPAAVTKCDATSFDYRATLQVIDGVSWMKAADAHALMGLALHDANRRATRWMIGAMVVFFALGLATGLRWEWLWQR